LVPHAKLSRYVPQATLLSAQNKRKEGNVSELGDVADLMMWVFSKLQDVATPYILLLYSSSPSPYHQKLCVWWVGRSVCTVANAWWLLDSQLKHLRERYLFACIAPHALQTVVL